MANQIIGVHPFLVRTSYDLSLMVHLDREVSRREVSEIRVLTIDDAFTKVSPAIDVRHRYTVLTSFGPLTG